MGKVYQRAVMRCPGIIFPTPYPQGYGATPPLPRPPQSACDVPGSMPEAAPYGNAGCVVHRACVSRKPHRVTGGRQAPPVTHRRCGVMASRAPHRRTASGSTAAQQCQEATPQRCSAVHRRRSPAWRSAHPPPRPPVHPPTGYRHPTGSLPSPSRPAGSSPRPPGRWRVRAPSHRRGCAPVKRRIQTCATIYFQPTSHPCLFLGQLADQPPCHQARRDQAVRFHPTGTGHECEAHFPARLLSETLRDRMLPAKLPCRHSAGWSTCHAGTAGRSRFDLGCRRLGTRARPRGNVQERQARKDQGDANTEGGLAS